MINHALYTASLRACSVLLILVEVIYLLSGKIELISASLGSLLIVALYVNTEGRPLKKEVDNGYYAIVGFAVAYLLGLPTLHFVSIVALCWFYLADRELRRLKVRLSARDLN